jgi:hypothetical protein
MLLKKKNERQIGFYSTFEEQLSRQHPLYILASKIQWEVFEKAFVTSIHRKVVLQNPFE